MKLPTIPPWLAGEIVKYRPFSEPIRLQDLEDSARSQAWKRKIIIIKKPVFFVSLKQNEGLRIISGWNKLFPWKILIFART